MWEGVGDRTERQHIDLPSPSRHSRVSFSSSLTAQQGAWGPSLSVTCSHPSIFSPTGLQTQSGVPRTPSAGWWLSLPHLVSNSSDLQLTDFLFSPSYIIVQSPTQSLDRYQAEITAMQFRGHPLPVHQFLPVPWDFTLSHIVSQVCLRDFFS